MNQHERMLYEGKRALDAGDLGRALTIADEAICQDHQDPIAYFIAGTALLRNDQPGLALPYFTRCVGLEPDRAEAWNNLGACYQERDPRSAYRSFKKGHELNRTHPEILSNLCSSASALGRFAEAVDWADTCLAMYPEHPDAIYNASLALLQMGRWDEAWSRYARSIGVNKSRAMRNYHIDRETPRWDPGETQEDDLVVIYGEQGLGDQILFASMVDDAIRQGCKVILEVSSKLKNLFARSFPGVRVEGTVKEDFCEWPADLPITHKLEMGGLGEFFAPEPFRRGQYLKACSALSSAWSTYLRCFELNPKMRVGIAWTAGLPSTGADSRTVPVELLSRLFGIKGVQWVNLEYRPGEETPALDARLWSKNLDYDDTAALVDALDLIIAPTTSVVDLAGAMGKEVWVMCPQNPPWRYSDFAGDEQMWIYESARIFRQKEAGDWQQVVEDIATRLETRLALKGGAA